MVPIQKPFSFSDTAIANNQSRKENSRNERSRYLGQRNSDPGIGRSYTKYGGYNGWPDDAIDSAFEGDLEATWNVD